METVFLISGSPKNMGNTVQVLEKCAVKINQVGLRTEILSIANKKIEACTACGNCEGRGKCCLNDDLNEIIEKIRKAKGFIIGTPVYFGTARGDLMNLLQRVGYVSRKNDNFLSWKVGGPIAINRRGGSTATIQELLMFFLINDMIIPGSNYWNIVFGSKPGDVIKDEEGVRTVEKFADNVAKLILKLYQ